MCLIEGGRGSVRVESSTGRTHAIKVSFAEVLSPTLSFAQGVGCKTVPRVLAFFLVFPC